MKLTLDMEVDSLVGIEIDTDNPPTWEEVCLMMRDELIDRLQRDEIQFKCEDTWDAETGNYGDFDWNILKG